MVAESPHPMVGERLVLELISSLDRDEFELSIIPGVGRDGAATAAIGEMPSPEGLKVLMAPELVIDNIDTDLATVVLDIDSPLTASDVKLHLLRAYPPEHGVYICKNDEDGRLHHRKIALHEMDRLEEYDYTTCLYIPPVKLRDLEEFDFRDLVRVMDMLRAPDGCPWDREQTHESLRQYLLEETYSIRPCLKDTHKMVEELGDVLLRWSSMPDRERAWEFDIRDITTGICRK